MRLMGGAGETGWDGVGVRTPGEGICAVFQRLLQNVKNP